VITKQVALNGIASAFRFILLNSISPMHSVARVKIDKFRQAFLAAIAIFAQCIVIVAPSGGMPSNIDEIYTSMRNTFSGLQFCRLQRGPISIRLAVVAFQMCEIARNSKKIRTCSSSRLSKVINLDANRKLIATSY